ncbi:hypothetical protein CEK62_20765 (plasmid) [Alcanivorax sp. N3-2A]|nr:hypothetical protein CEK62_00570 [Alcanivorax sp. N3-2A]ASK36796.1 hypothetical protein CEK62_20765 [Alcanivorax sp. N3-2A]|tara:strand:- start:47092 stop:47796 length:705 start_codon:yes stop_codon:yes gene_type:complete
MNAGERLQHYLERFFALRQHGDDSLFLDRLHRLQSFQRQRLMATHQALLADPRLRPGVEFLLDDVYGGRHLLPVAREIRRALPKAMKLLPDRVMSTSALALEAAIITQELDEALTACLGERLDTALDEAAYAQAYQTLGREPERRQQLALIAGLGEPLDRYIRSRMLLSTFRLVRKPAHAAGFTNLYDFIDKSFRVMKPVPSVGRLLQQVAADETVILERLFAHHPAPFKDVPQ